MAQDVEAINKCFRDTVSVGIAPHEIPAYHENIRRAGIVSIVVVTVGSDEHDVTAERDRDAKMVGFRRIARDQLLLLDPARAIETENVCGAGIVPVLIVLYGSNHGDIAVDRDRLASRR